MATFTPIADGEPANAATWNARYTELAAAIAAAGAPVCQGRLTLASGDPAPLSGQTAKTTLYFTPDGGNRLALFDGAAWGSLAFAETSLSLAGTAANTNYDVFAYNNAGALALERVAWSGDTARATALVRQDGIYVKAGDTTRRYLGTIRTVAAGQCEDSETRRQVWNYHNRRARALQISNATSHAYGTAAWRAWNGDATLRFHLVAGVVEDALLLTVSGVIDPSADGIEGWAGLHMNGTTSATVAAFNANAEQIRAGEGRPWIPPAAGYHFGQLTEFATGAVTFVGNAGTGVLLG